MNTPIKAWHFINNDFTILTDSMTRPLKVHQGQVLRHRGPLELCKKGLHASIKPIDALKYAPGAVVYRVECSGDVIQGDDKLVCSRRRVLWVADAERTLKADLLSPHLEHCCSRFWSNTPVHFKSDVPLED